MLLKFTGQVILCCNNLPGTVLCCGIMYVMNACTELVCACTAGSSLSLMMKLPKDRRGCGWLTYVQFTVNLWVYHRWGMGCTGRMKHKLSSLCASSCALCLPVGPSVLQAAALNPYRDWSWANATFMSYIAEPSHLHPEPGDNTDCF